MAEPASTTPDPYEPRPTLWQRRPHLGWALSVFALTVLLTVVSFPPANIGEAAFVFAMPAVFWAFRRPGFRLYAGVVLGANALAWTILFGWLHHVTWLGMLLLGPFIGLLIGSWYLAAWWVVPRLQGHQAMVRILAMLGLAALWVLLEWVRTWLLGGFPWLPLAASQWLRPFMLQSAAYGGAGTVAFMLLCFNLGTAAYAHRIFFEGATGLKKRSPEFSVALLVMMAATFPFLGDFFGQQRHPIAALTVVQPDIPQNEKWDESQGRAILQTIERLTLEAARSGPTDLIVWPEAVVPWALDRDPSVRDWLESLARRTGRPMLLGAISQQPEDQWFNQVVLVDPVAGLQTLRYAKRKLVPFGEYVPLRPVLGWLEKVVPVGGDFARGQSAEPLPLPVGGRPLPAGVLICYEDIFPSLARASALAGAEVFTVLTNNGWFGEGGAAYQHAAHSVLRAIETRRPVVRCGNAGWSGWIDEFGNIRQTVTNPEGTIYFRGYRTLHVTRDVRWHGRMSPYTANGEWFVLLCGALAIGAGVVLSSLRPPRLQPDAGPVF